MDRSELLLKEKFQVEKYLQSTHLVMYVEASDLSIYFCPSVKQELHNIPLSPHSCMVE